MPKDNKWQITLGNFSDGFAPLAFSDSLSELGSAGNATAMSNADVLDNKLKQGPGLADLTNGSQAGVVDQLIQFIMDRATADDTTYALGTTKLFKLSSTTVTSGGSPSWPQTVTNMTEGESLVLLKDNLYGFYNKSSGGDILKMPLSTETIDPDWGSTTPATGAAALEKAPHPADKKEDIMLFGNGRYVGVYLEGSDTLNTTKLDFGQDAEIGDVLFHAGQWYIAVNSGITGTNRTQGQIFLYDGSAIPTTLDDETGVGMQRIGFLHRINGNVFVAYEDVSSAGFIIGVITGRSIQALARFTGSLPTFNQKTMYKNTLLFLADNLVYSAGSFVEALPFQLSQIAPGGDTSVGAIAAPFGTPLISSTDDATDYRLAKFSGLSTAATWESMVFPISEGKMLGMIDEIIVLTNTLGASARCDLTLGTDQDSTDSNTKQITTTGKRRHFFKTFGVNGIEDFKVKLDWSNGSATNNTEIRKIIIKGHFVSST